MRNNDRTIVLFMTTVLFLVFMLPVAAFAVGVTLNLSKSAAEVGDSVTASGITEPYAWVPLKIVSSSGTIASFDATKADASGKYSMDFVVSQDVSGVLTVVAGEGSNVANATLTVGSVTTGGGGGGGGGGGSTSATNQAVTSTTGTATVTPSAGGIISLGSEATVEVPANALTGTSAVEVKVQKVTTPPAVPAGFKLAGSVYEFSVGGKNTYSFEKNVTLKFSFDPADFAAGETPAIYYYDQAEDQWVSLDGAVSGSTITVQVNHFTKFAVLAAAKQEEKTTVTFNDSAGHWAGDKINKLVALSVISGYSDGSFKPDNNITRAEFATVLVKAFKMPPQNGKVFADTAGHWAKDYIATAAFNGWVSGYDDGSFGPDDLVTREQMAVMVVSAAKLAMTSEGNSFTDSASISDWARSAVTTAVKNEIIKGYPDNTVHPQGNATRAEAVTVIINAME